MWWVDEYRRVLGEYDASPQPGAIAVPGAPYDASCGWNGTEWEISASAKNALKTRIDQEADAYLADLVSPYPGINAVLLGMLIERVVLDSPAALPATPENYPLLASLTGLVVAAGDIHAAALHVSSVTAQWSAVAAPINAARLLLKARVDMATTAAEMDAILVGAPWR